MHEPFTARIFARFHGTFGAQLRVVEGVRDGCVGRGVEKRGEPAEQPFENEPLRSLGRRSRLPLARKSLAPDARCKVRERFGFHCRQPRFTQFAELRESRTRPIGKCGILIAAYDVPSQPQIPLGSQRLARTVGAGSVSSEKSGRCGFGGSAHSVASDASERANARFPSVRRSQSCRNGSTTFHSRASASSARRSANTFQSPAIDTGTPRSSSAVS